MGTPLGAKETMPEANEGADQRTAALLFGELWDTLSDILGGPVTAALIRRSSKRAVLRQPQLSALDVRREGFAYRYTVPVAWSAPPPENIGAVQDLARELGPLLFDMTGEVVLRRVQRIPELQDVLQDIGAQTR